MPNINQAYQWAINTCNASNVGYSQTYRNQQTVNGITYYDCSSFIWYALIAGGFDCVNANGGNTWPFTTYTMGTVLLNLGFTHYSADNVTWLPGDILVVNSSTHQHTEMVYNGRVTMGAHTSRYPLDRQVSINTYETGSGVYTDLYRFGDGAMEGYDWIKGNRYLDYTEMQNNAYIFYSIMYYRGWTLNAVAGALGNIQKESTINPGIWQSLTVNPANGFGLVQWTPSTNYTYWAASNGYGNDDGDGQCRWIDEQTVPSGQWISTDEYPMSFEEFKTSDWLPENLASVFLKNFERAGVEAEDERRENAKYWYNYLWGLSPINPRRKKKSGVWKKCGLVRRRVYNIWR